MKTYLPTDEIKDVKWRIVDADGQVLGRLAARIAQVLRGKDKPIFTPHLDTGDAVIVINAARVVLTGRKETRKIYQDYSGHMSGLKERTAAQVRATHPTELVRRAVRGMMPRGRLGRAQLTKLRIYPGNEHPHTAQTPEPLLID